MVFVEIAYRIQRNVLSSVATDNIDPDINLRCDHYQ